MATKSNNPESLDKKEFNHNRLQEINSFLDKIESSYVKLNAIGFVPALVSVISTLVTEKILNNFFISFIIIPFIIINLYFLIIRQLWAYQRLVETSVFEIRHICSLYPIYDFTATRASNLIISLIHIRRAWFQWMFVFSFFTIILIIVYFSITKGVVP